MRRHIGSMATVNQRCRRHDSVPSSFTGLRTGEWFLFNASYVQGLVTEADDVSLSTIYEPPPNAKPLPHYAESTYINLRMRALAILERSSKLMYLKSEPGWQDKLPDHTMVSPPLSTFNSPSDWAEDVISYEQYLACFGTSTTEKNNHPVQVDKANRGGKGWMRCARVRTPKAYAEIYAALKRIEGDLPPEWRTNWEVWDGNVQDWHFGSTARRELAVLVRRDLWFFDLRADLTAFHSGLRLDVPL
jgi:hypothetical protein